MDNPSATLRIVFEDAAADGFISLEQDADKGAAFFKVYASDFTAYVIETSGQKAVRRNPGQPEAKTETLSFAAEASAELSALPSRVLSWKWIGNQGPAPSFDGRAASLSAPVVGLLSVTYQTLFDRWEVPGLKAEVLIVGLLAADKASLTLAPAQGADDDYEVFVTDHCTGDPVANASVQVGANHGYTDKNGKIKVGKLEPGSHSLHVVAEDYIPSPEDSLKNDIVVIPPSS